MLCISYETGAGLLFSHLYFGSFGFASFRFPYLLSCVFGLDLCVFVLEGLGEVGPRCPSSSFSLLVFVLICSVALLGCCLACLCDCLSSDDLTSPNLFWGPLWFWFSFSCPSYLGPLPKSSCTYAAKQNDKTLGEVLFCMVLAMVIVPVAVDVGAL